MRDTAPLTDPLFPKTPERRSSAGLLALSFALALSMPACSNNVGVDGTHDAGVDAPTRTGPYDECGNGMDDDGDGQIDEGCFCGGGETQPCFSGTYPNRGVGACADGVQTCDATSTMEFGHWGACTMDTLPAEEACDGVDNDCDGAIDEGCPCTAGQTQGCGSEFAIAPCSAGTQTCGTDGTWSACEGAIGPSAEACGTGAGDGIDNDCDGETDEGCTCVPEPEVCSDGVDNDCDGTVDEASCTLSMTLPDACVAGPVEICGDLIDNNCDGTVDEPTCTFTSGLDGGMDSSLPPPESCDGEAIPDFRDRILWHTAIPRAVDQNGNVGAHSRMHVAGLADEYVAVAMRTGTGSGLGRSSDYAFGSATYTDDRIGYLRMSDGSADVAQPWTGPGRLFAISKNHLVTGGDFSGTLDVGFATWMNSPTLYLFPSGPSTMNERYALLSTIRSGPAVSGVHYNVSGVAAYPDPSSYLPYIRIGGVDTDKDGNIYVVGSTSGAIALGPTTLNPSPSRALPIGYVASLRADGALRWLQQIDVEAPSGFGGLSITTFDVDSEGNYIAIAAHQSADAHVDLEVRSASTGDIVWSLHGSSPSSTALLAVSIDSMGNVVVAGVARQPFAIGSLRLSENDVYIASFDISGSLMWSHRLFVNDLSRYGITRIDVTTNGTEVAVLLGTKGGADSPGRFVDFGTCSRTVPYRRYPHGDTSGLPVLASVLGDTLGTRSEPVYDDVVGVLDAATGEHRWSRIADSPQRSASIDLTRTGDVILALHNENPRGAAMVQQDFGAGLENDATYVFRLRGH